MSHVIAETGQTMTSQEMAELCGARHNDVVATIARLYEQGVLRDRRKTPREHIPEGGGRPTKVYDLSYRDCMVVVSGYKPEVRARIIDRWMELEKAAAPQLPQSFAQALRLAAEQQELIEQQAAQLAIAVPKAEFVDRYVEASSGSKGFREVCKLLKAKEPAFRLFLEDAKIMYRLGGAWTAYQNHIDAGRFEVKTGTANDHAFTQAKFTAKGVEWVAGEWAKYQIKDAT
jgi:phage antirepressor YoqD-like protein/predicted transcriptional regulator